MMTKFLIILFLSFVILGSTLHDSGITKEELINVSEEISYDNLDSLTTIRENADDTNQHFISRFVYKIADAFIFVSVKGSQSSLKFGYENPQYNFGLIITLFLIGTLLIPLIYVGLFLYYGISAIGKWVGKKHGGV